MKSNNQSILQHLAEESAPDLQKQIVSEFSTHQSNVKTLNGEYKDLENKQEEVYKQLQNIRLRGKKNTVSNALREVNKRARPRNENMSNVKSYLTRLQTWGVEGYKEVVSFREFITRGQKLEYDIVTANSYHMFHLKEDDYLQLLSAGRVVTRANTWEKVTPSDLNKVLSISVANPTTTFYALAKQATKTKDKIAAAEYKDKARRFINISSEDKKKVHADVLNAFLYKRFGDVMPPSRLAELYSQVRYSLFPGVDTDESIEKKHFNMYNQPGISQYERVLDFCNKYIDTGLNKDNDAFYKTGDAIKDNNTLIENKFGTSASVSINTIRNAIKSLDETINRETLDKNQLINDLVQLYTAKGGNEFAESIHGAARERAIEGIKETIGTMFNGADVQIS